MVSNCARLRGGASGDAGQGPSLPGGSCVSVEGLLFPSTLALGASQAVLKDHVHLQCQDKPRRLFQLKTSLLCAFVCILFLLCSILNILHSSVCIFIEQLEKRPALLL